jgi:RND superfamily putative drug exporter
VEAWTRRIIRHRRKVIVAWLVVVVLGGAAAAGLGDLLSNRFSVPGSEAEKGRQILSKTMGEKGDGDFTLVVRTAPGRARTQAFQASVEAASRRAAAVVKRGKSGPVQHAGGGVVYTQIPTPLEAVDASKKTKRMRRAIGSIPGARTYLTGFPAILEDTKQINNDDLARGESIAIPVALFVMAFMFGTLGSMAVPILFALATIPTSLGIVWIFAHVIAMATYVTQIVALIGLAIAIDYSMLVVFRYREELATADDAHDALTRTMATAGRATLFSGMTVALGLALLVLMPLPFMRSMGIGGLMAPLVSIVASATLLPALLATLGRGVNRIPILFGARRRLAKRAQGEGGFWHGLARSIMRRPLPYLAVSAGILAALALLATGLRLTGGDNRGIPTTRESTRGLALLERTIGPGALAPNQIVIDTGRPDGAFSPAAVRAERLLVASLRSDREVKPSTVLAPASIAPRTGPPPAAVRARLERSALVDRTGRVLQVRAAPFHDAGTDQAVDLVKRIRDEYVPAAGLTRADVYVTGAPAFGVDVQDKAFTYFPWLVAAVLVLTYLLLLRAFRSVFLPLKAVVMNVLSVGATYGVLVLVFQHGWGDGIGIQSSAQIDFWIPIFLFAMVFGLSMDYEVFLLSRMREEWDARHRNEEAVAYGLEHTGRIITACAIIMVAAFSGFIASSFVSLQEFGVGLAVAIFLDATLVRAILVPSFMKIMGDWNWYLPERVRRALRLRPGGAAPAVAPVPGDSGS